MFNRMFYVSLRLQSDAIGQDVLHVLSRSISASVVLKCGQTPHGPSKGSQGDGCQPVTPPPFPNHDWIGPIDRRSNLRRVIPAHPENETDAERVYRLQREETMEWNHRFWSQQNECFIKAKEEFVKKHLAESAHLEDTIRDGEVTSGVKPILSAEEMARFYQHFLRENQAVFRDYNKQWYRRNISLLWPALVASIHRVMKNKR